MQGTAGTSFFEAGSRSQGQLAHGGAWFIMFGREPLLTTVQTSA
ncbi:hypothetical protein DUI70_7020 [Streptomyces albus]|nr:hypothetical protein DUI70_7020 [Streptomyces albus]